MRKIILLIACASFIMAGAACAAVGIIEDTKNYDNPATDLNFCDGFTVTQDGSVTSLTVSGASATPTITGGTINGATVGASSPSTGAFTTLAATTTTALSGTVSLTATGDNITLFGRALTTSGTSLYWAGIKLTN